MRGGLGNEARDGGGGGLTVRTPDARLSTWDPENNWEPRKGLEQEWFLFFPRR